MKRAVSTFLLSLLSSLFIFGQSEIEFPDFKLLRAEEDYSFLKEYLPLRGVLQKIKFIHLGETTYLSLGGELRSEFQRLKNENWIKDNDDTALFQRFMLHMDWHLGQHFRLFGQLKSGLTFGRNGPPFFLNNDDLDVHQLFAGIRIGSSTLEIGRRELVYGSRRLISVREGTNVRQSFDGGRWIWQKKDFRLDLLFYAYNPQQTGFFDNRINTDRLLWGAYSVWNLSDEQYLNFDFYYLGVDNNSSLFEEGTQPETRHSFGLRHWGEKGRFKYNNELILQTGTYGIGKIHAWTISTETYFQLPGKWEPTIGLKAEIISGDKDPQDGDLQTFNPLYPRGGYFGLLALIGPSNLMDIHPSLKIKPAKRLLINLDWDLFWRHRLTDGIYFPSGRLNVEGRLSNNRFIGHQAGLQVAFAVSRFLEVETSYFYFFPGDFMRDRTPGANFSQLGFSCSFKF